METPKMKTVTLEVASRDAVTRRALEAFQGRKQRARISFATPELLWKVLTAKRWELLKAMAGQGPLTIREIARRVRRDVKAVHGDVHALINAGLLGKTPQNRVEFPFGAIRVDFTVRAA
jgi:predicted transcriptional regulator